jgi:hypothetical protein
VSTGKVSLTEITTFCSSFLTVHFSTEDQNLGIFLLQKCYNNNLSEVPNMDKFVEPPCMKKFLENEKASSKIKSLYYEFRDRVYEESEEESEEDVE